MVQVHDRIGRQGEWRRADGTRANAHDDLDACREQRARAPCAGVPQNERLNDHRDQLTAPGLNAAQTACLLGHPSALKDPLRDLVWEG